MSDRATIYRALLNEWIDPYHAARGQPVRAAPSDLDRVEAELGTVLPGLLRVWFEEVGTAPLSTLDAVADLGLAAAVDGPDRPDISSIHTAQEIIDSTTRWRAAGMPNDLIAFASDCMGNQFCVPAMATSEERSTTSSVIFWDHDLGERRILADDLDAFAQSYLADDLLRARDAAQSEADEAE